MTSSLYPPALHFGIPEKMQPHVRTSDSLPERYQQYRIAQATEISYSEAPFGSYLTQHIQDTDWVISWQHCFVKDKVRLQPSVNESMIAMYCIMQGNISCRLQGKGKLMLIEKEFGIYYIPSNSQNIAELRPGYYEMICISFSPAFFKNFIAHHASFDEIYQLHQRQARRAALLPAIRMDASDLKVLLEMRQPPAVSATLKSFIDEKIQELITQYINALTPKYLQNGDQAQKLRQICQYIQHHYHQPLSISELSKQAGMHINTFERAFKELLSVSPRGYIEHLRLKKAALLLSQTSLSIKEISYSSGYRGANYFTAVFRKRYRCSPREYRKNRLT
ncbi:helix-turn-helix domain-containing protein [Chitinophaga rhizophila]|uniref:AraC family transcriptional regulator n=1 Tax=Chitinophaga rhizophila TaxID=2866212 RepID=A0ABS7GG20_9BACT|nr:helix-turn-helix domain-containing protein [Chitinophaga rhizophila]MBW8686637.1 AraC family transcriptional regulator [Chitinophaga rhizophila]